VEDILSLWLMGIAIGAIIVLPAYLFAWFSLRVNTIGALAGMVAGAAYCGLWILGADQFDTQNILIGLVVNISVTLLTSVLTKRPEREVMMRTYYWSEKYKSVTHIPK
jgi:Na+/proline symporter